VEAELADVKRVLTAKARVTMKVLMIGDCLYRDVASFLTAPALEDEITIVPTFLMSKNPAELRNELGKLKDEAFDLVFFSPFTYEFSPDYARTLSWKFALRHPHQVRDVVDATFDATAKTLDLVSELFECAIFVHNSANVRRHDGRAKERVKNRLTRFIRRRARQQVNARLAAHVAKRNAATYEHVFVLDETRFFAEASEDALGKTFYDSDEQHPAALGKYIAREYRDILHVHAHLVKKKLVVCDLDNTLWKGIIGEGDVLHYADKQATLKRLKDKGVVLAINSKNDPKNVHFRGGVLQEDDFVCSVINWEPKASNIKRIEKDLNLKSKDFVFIDDRADEREMVASAHPGLVALDATSDRAWGLIERWAAFAPRSDEDRTAFYKQREAREQFLDAGGQEDPGEMFEKLGLEVTIRTADKKDLKRVAELINRTNQFNMCGSRTTVREISEWHDSGSRRILVVDASDKFGSMGTISIVVVHEQADTIEIPIFVLSCRVFGYRIEDAVINVVKRRAADKALPILGHFKETPHNEPCRKVYPNNGFEWNGSAWSYTRGDALEKLEDPRWLTIRNEAIG
jgi:FkbH-like protein